MKKLVISSILLAMVIFAAGCTGGGESSPNTSAASQKYNVVEITNLSQINESLKTGPVLVKLGSEDCGPCQSMKPMLEELADEYGGKATIGSIDIDKSPDLNSFFITSYIPDSSVIVGIENGQYMYMQDDGNVSKDRLESRILGLREKEEYENLLNYALLEQAKGTPSK